MESYSGESETDELQMMTDLMILNSILNLEGDERLSYLVKEKMMARN